MRKQPKHMAHEAHHDHEAQKNERWDDDRVLVKKVKKAGGYQKWVAAHERSEIGAAFPKDVSCVCCMDDRVVAQKSNAVYSAGSGILIKDNPAKRDAFIADLRKRGVKNTTTHEGCGAVALYAGKKYGYDAKKKGDAKNDAKLDRAKQDAREWATYLANRLNGHNEGELGVSPEFHIAQVLYYDMTGNFNPGNTPHLFPPGLVVSRKYMDAASAKAQVGVGISIATGEHGYGKRFNLLNKFRLVVVGSTPAEVSKGKSEVRGLTGLKVGVDGFTVPSVA